MGACQIATQACDLRPRSVPTVMVRGDLPVRWANTASIRGSITAFAGRSGSSRAQARTCNKRTARGDNRPEPPHQAINARPLPLFYATPTFEALMIVLHQPPVPIPVDPFPGLCKRRGGNRGQQNPFQRLLAFGSLLFPDADDPHGQGLLACAWRVRGVARVSSAQRQAAIGSNALGDHAWREPRTDGSPGSARTVPAEAHS